MDLIHQINGAKSFDSPTSRLLQQLDIDFDSGSEDSPLIKDYSTRLIEFSASWQTPPYLVSPVKLAGPPDSIAETKNYQNINQMVGAPLGQNSRSRCVPDNKQLVYK